MSATESMARGLGIRDLYLLTETAETWFSGLGYETVDRSVLPPGILASDEVASADWLILSHIWDGWQEPNGSRDLELDAPNQVVRDQFCKVADYGPYEGLPALHQPVTWR